uniref:Protein binding protein n=1 Tax=Rhizophora mucronata TaxID=61149 RepID=A0A2P2JQG7_RHIMU
MVYVSCPSDNKMILATGFFLLLSTITLAPFLRPSAIFVPPSDTRQLTDCNASCLPVSVMRRSGKRRRAVEEKAMTESRSRGPRFCITNPIARLSKASFVPAMLPLTSRIVMRSTGARES